ncbi:bZIP transcription factor ABI5 homolog [Aegilops tauschii subsp. strangulata]|uniref:BZIP domain-containing protein n=2 Tax=Aegilops tauschii TaxID=37682 RepID=A0A453FZ68_AEGTS|nr:bZIP transcription factor ABI5 homolog [Aegilops tauschii subsp. strangulata]
MASEMSKDMKFSEEEVTLHLRILGGDERTVAPARQSSIFALTLDGLQYSVCEAGRNFGSMNMDEFTSNIWNAKEFQAATGGVLVGMEVAPVVGAGGGGGSEDAGGSKLAWHESFSLPPPLCRKTVEEVWAKINREPHPVHSRPSPQIPVQPPPGNGGAVAANDQQGTFGEMTLEQFLVKAGVVRGSGTDGQAHVPVGMVHGQMNPVQQGQQPGPMMYPMAPANDTFLVMGDDMGFIPNGYAGMVVVPPPPPPQGAVGIMSPGSSDGRSAMTQVDMMNCMGDGAMMENGGARKRGAPEDQSCESSNEHHHRRMIKNHESAAQSCARKQAYTVELETELNHLKEENACLKAEEKTILLTKKQMLVEKMMERSKENVNAKKGGALSRRCGSCIW